MVKTRANLILLIGAMGAPINIVKTGELIDKIVASQTIEAYITNHGLGAMAAQAVAYYLTGAPQPLWWGQARIDGDTAA